MIWQTKEFVYVGSSLPKRHRFHLNSIKYGRLGLIWIYVIGFLISVSRKTESDIFVKYKYRMASSLSSFRVLSSFPIHNSDKILLIFFLNMASKDYIRPFKKEQQKIIIFEQKIIELNEKTEKKQTEDLWIKLDWVSKLCALKDPSHWEGFTPIRR